MSRNLWRVCMGGLILAEVGMKIGGGDGMGSEEKVAFLAYDGERQRPLPKAPTVSYSFKVALVAMDCVLLGLQPVLVHLSKNREGGYSFHPVSINLSVELAKTLFALASLLVMGTGRPGVPMYRSLRSFVSDAHHNRALATPAGLYAINNHLKFAMQLFFRPTTTKMLGNLKIFVIALLMRTMLRRTFSTIQWEALFLLVAGITVNQLHSHCPVAGVVEKAIPLVPAALCTLGTITVPSAASVYNEHALKRHMDTSVHLQNFFLYLYGALFNVGILLAVSLYEGTSIPRMFAGQSTFTYLLIANNAAQGILSSFFFKYADTILKKYSSTLATIFTALASYALFGHELSTHFFIGVSIVLVSMHQFFTFGDKGEPATAANRAASRMVFSPSLEHISTATAVGSLHARGFAGPTPSHNGGGFFSPASMAAAPPAEPAPHPADDQALLVHRGDSFGSRRPSLLPR
ncbi:MAG: hypothetical protein WDW36_008034 [Sanguina aurantia]